MSENYVEQLRTALQVLDRHELRISADPVACAALQKGRTNKRAHYVAAMLGAALVRWRERHNIAILVRDVIEAARWSPRATMRTLFRSVGHRAVKIMPGAVVRDRTKLKTALLLNK